MAAHGDGDCAAMRDAVRRRVAGVCVKRSCERTCVHEFTRPRRRRTPPPPPPPARRRSRPPYPRDGLPLGLGHGLGLGLGLLRGIRLHGLGLRRLRLRPRLLRRAVAIRLRRRRVQRRLAAPLDALVRASVRLVEVEVGRPVGPVDHDAERAVGVERLDLADAPLGQRAVAALEHLDLDELAQRRRRVVGAGGLETLPHHRVKVAPRADHVLEPCVAHAFPRSTISGGQMLMSPSFEYVRAAPT